MAGGDRARSAGVAAGRAQRGCPAMGRRDRRTRVGVEIQSAAVARSRRHARRDPFRVLLAARADLCADGGRASQIVDHRLYTFALFTFCAICRARLARRRALAARRRRFGGARRAVAARRMGADLHRLQPRRGHVERAPVRHLRRGQPQARSGPGGAVAVRFRSRTTALGMARPRRRVRFPVDADPARRFARGVADVRTRRARIHVARGANAGAIRRFCVRDGVRRRSGRRGRLAYVAGFRRARAAQSAGVARVRTRRRRSRRRARAHLDHRRAHDPRASVTRRRCARISLCVSGVRRCR